MRDSRRRHDGSPAARHVQYDPNLRPSVQDVMRMLMNMSEETENESEKVQFISQSIESTDVRGGTGGRVVWVVESLSSPP